jgi:hypothetical protein
MHFAKLIKSLPYDIIPHLPLLPGIHKSDADVLFIEHLPSFASVAAQ